MLNEREWRKEHRPGWLLLVSAAAIYAATLFLYHYEMQFSLTDLAVHANIAADFDFTDLHSITSRLAYPLWHLMTSCVYQLGLPIEWAAPVICSLCKVLTFVLTQRVLVGLCRGGELLRHVGVSCLETVVGFLAGTLLGTAIAICMW